MCITLHEVYCMAKEMLPLYQKSSFPWKLSRVSLLVFKALSFLPKLLTSAFVAGMSPKHARINGRGYVPIKLYLHQLGVGQSLPMPALLFLKE